MRQLMVSILITCDTCVMFTQFTLRLFFTHMHWVLTLPKFITLGLNVSILYSMKTTFTITPRIPLAASNQPQHVHNDIMYVM